ncbi:type I polyketide synthase [Streptomyces sp. NPDC012751]|uniref:type I polyketide synthase n=1 Tax=Streptomyces sp. NPDC012751 TaxID=3364846 RepID=UPI00369A514F
MKETDGVPGTSYRAELTAALRAVREARVRLEELQEERHEPIAVVGMGCRFPGGATSPARFWDLLCDGTDTVTPVPAERWGGGGSPADSPGPPAFGSFIEEVDAFDARFFGIAPAEAARMDPQQRLFLEVAWEALEDAGRTRQDLRGAEVGVFVGANSSEYFHLQLAASDDVDMHTLLGGTGSAIANRLSYVLDLRGPSMVVDSACSSSLVAVHLACRSLRQRECSGAVAGGVQLLLSPTVARTYADDGLLASDGRCKTFDASADGFTRAEGVGAVVLRRLSDALADGDRIWAVIRGTAVNQDGRTNGMLAPSGPAQQEVVRRALRDAGLPPGRITLVEAHGTGTALGDPIEVEALAESYGKDDGSGFGCALGSAKSNIGHLEPAAGIAGLIKAALSIHHRRVPRTLHVREVNPRIALDGTRFEIPAKTRPWDVPDDHRNAAVSAFGAGGTNAHAILGPAPADTGRTPAPGGAYVLPVSAASGESLRAMAAAYRDHLRSPRGASTPFADTVHTAVARRTHHDHRLAVVAASPAEAADRIDAWLDDPAAAGTAWARSSSPLGRKTVFVFPGQGGQRPRMGRELMGSCPVFRAAVEECDEALRHRLGYSVIDTIHTMAQDAALTRTDLVQPALFALSVGLAARWRSWGVEPDAIVGHSMGEVAAAHVAGALGLEDAALVVSTRSRLLEGLSGRGAMLVAGLPEHEVEAVLARSGITEASVAAANGPAATIVAGTPEGVRELASRLAERKVFCKPLAAQGASHCRLVEGVLDEMTRALSGLTPTATRVPLYSTVTGEVVAGTDLGAAYWAANVRRTVRFRDAVRALARDGHGIFLEMGPHPTLTSSVQDTLDADSVPGLALPVMRREEPEDRAGLEALGALYTRSLPVGLGPGPECARVVSLPVYRWAHERFWFRTRRPAGSAGPPAPTTTGTAAVPDGPAPTAVFAGPAPAAVPAGPAPAAVPAGPAPAAVPAGPAPTAVPAGPRSGTGPGPGSGSGSGSRSAFALVREAVADVLGYRPAEVDPDEGFFQMGMDSAMAVRVVARLRKAWDRPISAAVLFECPTVRALAEALGQEARGDTAPTAGPAPAAAPPPPTGGAPLPGPGDDPLGLLDEDVLRDLLLKELGTACQRPAKEA